MDATVYIHLKDRKFYHNLSEQKTCYCIDIGESDTYHATFFVSLDQARQIIRGLAGQLRGIERGLEDGERGSI